jgi:hypothetical protein
MPGSALLARVNIQNSIVVSTGRNVCPGDQSSEAGSIGGAKNEPPKVRMPLNKSGGDEWLLPAMAH